MGSFNEGYLDKPNTTSVNGVFVILIVFSHYAQYAGFEGACDGLYLAVREHLNQMVVASFLFYSGYGIMESIKKKGEAYVDRLVTKFWQLLLRFDIAVLLFLGLDAALGIRYPAKHIALAFTSWTAVGNSNWYITAILMIYICIFAVFKLGYRVSGEAALRYGAWLTLIMVIGCVYLQMKLGRPGYCYNTMILAPLGMFWSQYREIVRKWIMRNDFTYLLTLAAVTAVYRISFIHRWNYGIEGYSVWAVSFTTLLVLLTMKLRIHNKILEWLGAHVFSIYVLQRIPMLLLDHFGCISENAYLSLIAAFAATIALALVFEKATDAVIGRIMAGKR